jgi:hypothetical protein
MSGVNGKRIALLEARLGGELGVEPRVEPEKMGPKPS